jgi:hypothetical protein
MLLQGTWLETSDDASLAPLKLGQLGALDDPFVRAASMVVRQGLNLTLNALSRQAPTTC